MRLVDATIRPRSQAAAAIQRVVYEKWGHKFWQTLSNKIERRIPIFPTKLSTMLQVDTVDRRPFEFLSPSFFRFSAWRTRSRAAGVNVSTSSIGLCRDWVKFTEYRSVRRWLTCNLSFSLAFAVDLHFKSVTLKHNMTRWWSHNSKVLNYNGYPIFRWLRTCPNDFYSLWQITINKRVAYHR